MIRAGPILFIAIAVFVYLPGFAAQDPDIHFSVDPAAMAYRHSAFLHGYAHGYEMGFHNGDLELHMGRNARDAKTFKQFKDAKKYYRNDFGNRDAFTGGYEQGFRVGYGDAFMGRQFRAAQEVRMIAQQMRGGGATDPKPDNEFDKRIRDGYKDGLSAGLSDARNAVAYRGDAPPCNKGADACLAQELGYQLGYSDGYNNQRKPSEELKTASD